MTHQTPIVADPESAAGRYLVFTVGEMEYGIDVFAVRELRPWAPTTAIPHAEPYVVGLLNLRGVVLTVVDLATLFEIDCSAMEPRPRAVIVVVEIEGRMAGLLVDAVADLVDIGADETHPPPALSNGGQRHRFIHALAARGDRLIRLVSFDALLDGDAAA